MREPARRIRQAVEQVLARDVCCARTSLNATSTSDDGHEDATGIRGHMERDGTRSVGCMIARPTFSLNFADRYYKLWVAHAAV